MAQRKFNEEQIIGILQKQELGMKVSDVCRENNVSEATFYNWKARYGGLTVNEARRLRVLEEENRKLKHLVADLTLDNQALKALNSKNFLSPK